jgi:hypothetical protein
MILDKDSQASGVHVDKKRPTIPYPTRQLNGKRDFSHQAEKEGDDHHLDGEGYVCRQEQASFSPMQGKEKEYILADKSSLSSVLDPSRLLFGWRGKCL